MKTGHLDRTGAGQRSPALPITNLNYLRGEGRAGTFFTSILPYFFYVQLRVFMAHLNCPSYLILPFFIRLKVGMQFPASNICEK